MTGLKIEFVSPLDAARILSLSRQSIYDLVNDGELKGFQRGRKWFVEYDSVVAYADRLRAEAS